jgi:16S rRNA (cytidine1402-2'-O)-methyltransferase
MSNGQPLDPALYVVSTPIGSADDITLRALHVLTHADVLAAEDTRRLRKLMDIHGIPLAGRRIVACHDHNEAASAQGLVAAIGEGRSVAYASDAGTPLLADPGFALARAAIAAGQDVRAAPGASALLAALAVAGMPVDRFLFAGFPPPKEGARAKFLAEVMATSATLILYESPKRVARTLAAIADIEPGRQVALCRELTKRFEEVRRAAARDLANALAEETDPKGEIVLVLAPPAPVAHSDEDIDDMLRDALTRGSVKDAASEVAATTGQPRKALYARAQALKDAG